MNPNADLIKGLRDLADFMEQKAMPPFAGQLVCSIYAGDAPTFRAGAASMGRCEVEMPEERYSMLAMQRAFGAMVRLRLFTGAATLCRKATRTETIETTRWELVEPLFIEPEPELPAVPVEMQL